MIDMIKLLNTPLTRPDIVMTVSEVYRILKNPACMPSFRCVQFEQPISEDDEENELYYE